MGRSSWRTSRPAPVGPRASSRHPVADRGLDLILSLETPLTDENWIPAGVAWGFRQSRLVVSLQNTGPAARNSQPPQAALRAAVRAEGGWGGEVTRWLGDALWACQNSGAGIPGDRAIGGGVRAGDDLKKLTWLREPTPPRAEVLGTAW
jgi:hypothetical protein